MSKLFYRYGAMNSGKTTALMQVAYNYEERGQRVAIMKSSVDSKGENRIQSRLGIERDVDIMVSPYDNVREKFTNYCIEKYSDTHIKNLLVDCLLVDEVQFFTSKQVDQLFGIAVKLKIPVIAYGIRTDFQVGSFPGSSRLLEIAHSLEELKTICRCGRKAMFNGRIIDGEFIREGNSVAIDNEDGVSYESLCPECYLEKVNDFTY